MFVDHSKNNCAATCCIITTSKELRIDGLKMFKNRHCSIYEKHTVRLYFRNSYLKTNPTIKARFPLGNKLGYLATFGDILLTKLKIILTTFVRRFKLSITKSNILSSFDTIFNFEEQVLLFLQLVELLKIKKKK